MRVSCNGCRVLRKGCSEDCSIRPCLQWIKNPESQANATVFLAKFYGRAGLMNLINSGTEHLRPAIFRSLLYEACGRIVNPIYGSVGLLWSGSWQLCNAAVEAVLKGVPIMQISSEAAGVCPSSPLKSYDIRHVSKDGKSTSAQELHKVKTRSRFKRSASAVKTKPKASESAQPWYRRKLDEFNRAPSQDSLASQQTEMNGDGCSRESESMFSVETEEASLVNRADPEPVTKINEVGLDLELSLGFEPVSHARCIQRGGPTIENIEADPYDVDMHKIELGLDCPVA